ncbi:MAG: nlpC [Chitinophagaceae bacterium]|nr:nlpC [Chitinophagaceae bacterium]
MRIYLTVLLSFSLLLLTSSCKRSRTNTSSDRNSHKDHSAVRSPSDSKKKKEKQNHAANSDKAKKLIKTARSYTGTPYKYGGTSRSGLDCSGLTSISYQAVDITLPRTSQAQSGIGQAVDIDDIEPGDLVFFADNSRSKKITHVGIVTEVDGKNAKFIHASTKLGVVENELLSGYYYPLIVKFRRVL